MACSVYVIYMQNAYKFFFLYYRNILRDVFFDERFTRFGQNAVQAILLCFYIVIVEAIHMFNRPWIMLLMTSAIFLNCDKNPAESLFAPAISIQPKSQIVPLGSLVSFSVSITGNPAPTCQWWKAGTLLSGETDSIYTIPAAAFADSGIYSVVVSNSQGAVTSDSATLIVYTLTVQPTADTVSVDSPFTFTAAVSGIPDPTYQWRLDGFNISGATGLTYGKISATLDDAGTYRLIVSSPLEDVFRTRSYL